MNLTNGGNVDRRLLSALAVATLTVAGVGFMSATRAPPQAAQPAPLASAEDHAANLAKMPRYQGMMETRRGPNAAMYRSAFEKLVADRPGPFAPVEQTEEERARVLEARASRRAYSGAPPTIPHAIDQRAMPDCRVCHETGATIAGRRAPAMSHGRLDNCTQCHVTVASPEQLPSAELIENSFAPLQAEAKGSRAWPGAPPTMPHTTHMRENCSSCHGALGANGIRTSHPYRQSCQQCHVSSAVLDQRAAQPSPPPWEIKQ